MVTRIADDGAGCDARAGPDARLGANNGTRFNFDAILKDGGWIDAMLAAWGGCLWPLHRFGIEQRQGLRRRPDRAAWI